MDLRNFSKRIVIKNMNNDQFKKAVEIARDTNIDLSKFDISILNGFALASFKKVSIIIEVAAACIRWQCLQLNGGIDNENLNECKIHFRTKVQIV
jgi:hypothetical protein